LATVFLFVRGFRGRICCNDVLFLTLNFILLTTIRFLNGIEIHVTAIQAQFGLESFLIIFLDFLLLLPQTLNHMLVLFELNLHVGDLFVFMQRLLIKLVESFFILL